MGRVPPKNVWGGIFSWGKNTADNKLIKDLKHTLWSNLDPGSEG